MNDITDNYDHILERIRLAVDRAGRKTDEVTLVAVTKQIEINKIFQLYHAGHREFAENYWQEAKIKIEALPEDIRWHFIGHLQSNKAKYLVGRFNLVQSIDNFNSADALSKRALVFGGNCAVLVEVNIGGEKSKNGVAMGDLNQLTEQILALPGIELKGLMGIPPPKESPDLVRPYFRQLRTLFENLPGDNQQILSMGMSDDFEIAIEEGSTMVRIGTAIFGGRLK